MTLNRHALAARAYLEELCSMIAVRRRLHRPRRDWWSRSCSVAAASALASCGGTVMRAEENEGPSEACYDGVDNDHDGHVDCEDSDCPACDTPLYSAPADASSESTDAVAAPPDGPWVLDANEEEVKTDAADDKGDAPAEAGPILETCANGTDDDGDGLADCDDPECWAMQCCTGAEAGGWKEALCHDGQDDDCDGFADCLDLDCVASACCSATEYAAPPPEDCTSPDDEDCDGLIDCEDEDCCDQGDCPGCSTVAYAAPQE